MPSCGVLLHAFGAERFNYYELADQCARLIQKFLGLPITLITDRVPSSKLYDKVIEIRSNSDYKRILCNKEDHKSQSIQYTYRNDTRSLSLELTPYDRTLLIDSDYLVFNDDLLKYLTSDYDFLCPYTALDVSGRNGYSGFKYLSNAIPQAWATVVIFNKSEFSQSVFEHWRMIQQNYEYYGALLSKPEPFRNDYALSLAVHTMNGSQPMNEKLPPMFMSPGDSTIELITKRGDIVVCSDHRIIKLSKTNLHVMNKLCLQNPKIQEQIRELSA